MSKPDEEATHPTARALDALDQIIDGCRDLAMTFELDEGEGLLLHELTESFLALYDLFTSRLIVKAGEQGGDVSDQDVAAAKVRVKSRLTEQLAQNQSPETAQALFEALDEKEIPTC